MHDEQQPLLDVESCQRDSNSKSPRLRDRLAHRLESPLFHKTVLAFTAVDVGCVLAELIYTFLRPGCPMYGENPFWLEVLAHISLVITAFFVLELPLSLWAFGPQYYNPLGPDNYASLHLFDAVIILISFILEFVLRGREKELVGLLVVLRLWRLVKLVSGVATGAVTATQAEMESVRQELESTKAENASLRREIEELRQS